MNDTNDMNELKELKAHVERAVRPIPAGRRWKLRMREELFAHLVSIYEAELAQSGSRSAAFSRAKERFGEPETVGADLRRSLPFLDRCLHAPLPFSGAVRRVQRSLRRREGESSRRHAVRLALVLVGFDCLVLAPFLLLALDRPAEARPLLFLCSAAVILKDFVFILLSYALCRTVAAGVSAPSIFRATLYGLGGLLVQIASIPASFYLMIGGPPPGWKFPSWRLLPPALSIGLFLIGLAIAARLMAERKRRDQGWSALETGTS